ncbi:UDP-glucuronosyltransferase 1-7-like [Sitophilus oryzae]|uniref:UDP-glucuronosyltransferase n=1 Tax=Sitophilus oryzae TaxID=7048 RepID=A0A6J2YIA8_SITOR|nr:UDP-glucuronosyltransferase 1-7-like [Sitophilus oryzae]
MLVGKAAVVFLVLVKLTYSAKILFFCPLPAISHQKVYRSVIEELAVKGHEIHVVTPNPVYNESIPNIVNYNISIMYDLVKQESNAFMLRWFLNKPNFISMIFRQVILSLGAGVALSEFPNFKEIQRLTSNHQTFDVCVIEWIFPGFAVYGYKFKCPMIGISSVGLQIPMLDTVGNPSYPVIAPDLDLPLTRSLDSLYERTWSLFWWVFTKLYSHYITLPLLDAKIKKYYGNDVPYIGDIQNNVSLILLNRNMIFHRNVPNVPAVIEFGGYKRTPIVENISPALKSFLDDSKRGVVFFSLGSSVPASLLQSHVTIIQEAFASLPFEFIWKWDQETMENKPKNVFVSKWIPQLMVLNHPNVKLFISQGGLQSTEEAIAAHKPIIGIPFHSDQTTNVDTCVHFGMGKMLDVKDLTVETLRSYILEVINNISYAENAAKFDALMKDQPQDGLEKAVWWIEYVIRHRGAKHLRSTAVDLPWWKYLMLDVFALILAIVLATVFIFYFILKFLFKFVSKLFKKKSTIKKKSE